MHLAGDSDHRVAEMVASRDDLTALVCMKLAAHWNRAVRTGLLSEGRDELGGVRNDRGRACEVKNRTKSLSLGGRAPHLGGHLVEGRVRGEFQAGEPEVGFVETLARVAQ